VLLSNTCLQHASFTSASQTSFAKAPGTHSSPGLKAWGFLLRFYKTAYAYLLKRLKDLQYEPICVVSDDHSSISFLLEEEKIPHQLCIFHLLRTLRRMLTGNNKFTEPIPEKYQVMYSRMKGIFKTNHIEEIPVRVNDFRKLQIFWQSPKEKYILDWFWKILPNAIMCLSFEENAPRTSNLLGKPQWPDRAAFKNLQRR